MKVLISLTFLFYCFSSFALEVNVYCKGYWCSQVNDLSKNSFRKDDIKQLYDFLSFEIKKPIYRKFAFKYEDDEINLFIETNKKVESFEFNGKSNKCQLFESEMKTKRGNFYHYEKFQNEIIALQNKYFFEKPEVIDLQIVENTDGVSIKISCEVKSEQVVKKLLIQGKNSYARKISRSFFGEILNKTFNKNKFDIELKKFKLLLQEQGFWGSEVSYEIKSINKNNIHLIINLNVGERVAFLIRSVSGNLKFAEQKIQDFLKKELINSSDDIDQEEVKRLVKSFYKKENFHFTDVEIRESRGSDKLGQYQYFFLQVREGRRIKLQDIYFTGNNSFSDKELKRFYMNNVSVLLKREILDIEGLNAFQGVLKKHLVSKGFIYADVSRPIISIDEENESSFVTFKILEQAQYFIEEVKIEGVNNEKVVKGLLNVLSNKKGNAFDVEKMDQDILEAVNFLKNMGFYFTTLKNKNAKDIVSLDSINKKVRIRLSFNTGEKVYFGNLVISGNQETRGEVIRRELRIEHGELIRPQDVSSFVERLRTLGLFSSVKISPFLDAKKSDGKRFLNFIIKVKEVPFGAGEVAPGFRTDLGYKLTTTMSYNNFMGLNRSFIAKANANLRTSYSFLDDRREAEEKDILEGGLQFQYIEPYLGYGKFGITGPIEAKVSSKFQRRRYSSFDADIFSLSPTISKKFAEHFFSSVKYELDIIRQFDATDSEDEDRFRIGSITPSIIIDYRDNSIAPRRGNWLSFSWEFANPNFLSQSEDDLSINYNKGLFRNYHYFPLGGNCSSDFN